MIMIYSSVDASLAFLLEYINYENVEYYTCVGLRMQLSDTVLWFLSKCAPKASCTQKWGFWERTGSWGCGAYQWIDSLMRLWVTVMLGGET